MLVMLRVCSWQALLQGNSTNSIAGHPAEESTSRASESSRPSESSKPAGPASPNAGEEKSDSKMSGLKDKLKNKLHIGHKDK
jgi:hypothetical protein